MTLNQYGKQLKREKRKVDRIHIMKNKLWITSTIDGKMEGKSW